jgi:hypothetical protein
MHAVLARKKKNQSILQGPEGNRHTANMWGSHRQLIDGDSSTYFAVSCSSPWQRSRGGAGWGREGVRASTVTMQAFAWSPLWLT